jgi:hypothetical protein
MGEGLLLVAQNTWQVLLASSGWILLGLILAGLMEELIPRRWIERHLAGESFAATVKAALIGAPLPLCSCSVLPAAAALRRTGAGRGPTAAFLVSTPETGVDSISTTYALFDPITTLLRPLAAVLSAMGTGLLVSKYGSPVPALTQPGPSMDATTCCADEEPEHCMEEKPKDSHAPLFQRSLRKALGPLSADLALWLSVGLVLAGLAGALLPDNLLGVNSSLVAQYGLALIAGVPVYVCATASTPLAAALVAKGMDPGAALVFLLAGPATNLATLAVVRGLLGLRATFLYLGSIAGGAVLAGLTLGWLHERLGITPLEIVREHLHGETGYAEPIFATALILLLGYHLVSRLRPSSHAH